VSLIEAEHPKQCALCGVAIHPLLFRYCWLAYGWRGRPAPKPHRTHEWILCGPCADLALQAVIPYLGQERHRREHRAARVGDFRAVSDELRRLGLTGGNDAESESE
jgi:hypothetical protein